MTDIPLAACVALEPLVREQSRQSAWPRYESHKIVQATPIVAITRSAVGFPAKLYVDPSDTGAHEEFEPTEPAMANRAEIGGYAVVYEGGFKSISPKRAFEGGYTLVAEATP